MTTCFTLPPYAVWTLHPTPRRKPWLTSVHRQPIFCTRRPMCFVPNAISTPSALHEVISIEPAMKAHRPARAEDGCRCTDVSQVFRLGRGMKRPHRVAEAGEPCFIPSAQSSVKLTLDIPPKNPRSFVARIRSRNSGNNSNALPLQVLIMVSRPGCVHCKQKLRQQSSANPQPPGTTTQQAASSVASGGVVEML